MSTSLPKKRTRLWKRLLLFLLVIPVALFGTTLGLVYAKQGDIVQKLIATLNEGFRGELEVAGSHVDPFDSFPYIAIDLEGVKIYETKEDHAVPIADVSEVFLGFDLWTILSGNLNISQVKLKDGAIDLVQHLNGEFNIERALTSDVTLEEVEEAFHLSLSKIACENIDIHKFNEESDVVIDALVYEAEAKFSTQPEHTYVFFDSQFELNLIQEGDTTFIKHKHFDVTTEFDYATATEVLNIQPTTIQLEKSDFALEGSIDFKNEFLLDLLIQGTKPNFDLVIAMAPEELAPVFARYQNRGTIYFESTIRGKSIHGNSPAIDAKFGCKDGFLKNTTKNKVVDGLNFQGNFTNGAKRNPSTMALHIQDFTARPEAGNVTAGLSIENFDDPEVDFRVNSAFDLEFLADFFNLDEVSDMSGSIDLEMKFHDIVNIDSPQHVVAKLNEAYYANCKVQDLKFKYDANGQEIPVHDMDLFIEMNGHQADIKECEIKLGNSDLSLFGYISDLPAVLHHTDEEIDTRLTIKSDFLDLFELTGADSNAIDEQIKNLSLKLDFKSSARAMTESPNLPVGEFSIDSLNAAFQHYPHTLHDFYADILIEDEHIKIVDLKGIIDDSDFLFSGSLTHYDLWMAEVKRGDAIIDFDFSAKKLRLEDVFAYKGENYVPEEYRHEVFQNFKFHGNTVIHFQDSFQSIDLKLDHFNAKMKIHPLAFRECKGRVHYEAEHVVVEDFSGKMGHSDLKTTLHYYLGEDEAIKKRDNHFSLASNFLDVDEIINYNESPMAAEEPVEHDSVFNIYTLPFTDMTFDLDIGRLNYHAHTVDDINARLRTTQNHYIYVDTFTIRAAGGRIGSNGYFNGSNPNLIYLSPDMYIDKVDLDKLFFKFDNFGQDHLVSENLHGEFTGHLTGKIHLHADGVPKVDDSEIHLDAHVENGRLENFEMLKSFSKYFKNKNLEKVAFDTLENHLDIVNGVVAIPSMAINTSIGFLEIAGKTDADLNYEYYVRVPWKLVTGAVASKLFGRKKKDVDPDQIDEIQHGTEKTKYINVVITGDAEDYKVKLGKKKKKRRKRNK